MKVRVDADVLRGLIRDSLALSNLEDYGVDNWGGMERSR